MTRVSLRLGLGTRKSFDAATVRDVRDRNRNHRSPRNRGCRNPPEAI